METIGWIAVVIWAMFGVPYGMRVYNQRIAAGATKSDAIMKGIIRGVCAPVEIAFKAALGAVKGVLDNTNTPTPTPTPSPSNDNTGGTAQ